MNSDRGEYGGLDTTRQPRSQGLLFFPPTTKPAKALGTMLATWQLFRTEKQNKLPPRRLTLSLLRVINVKILLQPHKKYDITQYGELDFS